MQRHIKRDIIKQSPHYYQLQWIPAFQVLRQGKASPSYLKSFSWRYYGSFALKTSSLPLQSQPFPKYFSLLTSGQKQKLTKILSLNMFFMVPFHTSEHCPTAFPQSITWPLFLDNINLSPLPTMTSEVAKGERVPWMCFKSKTETSVLKASKFLIILVSSTLGNINDLSQKQRTRLPGQSHII